MVADATAPACMTLRDEILTKFTETLDSTSTSDNFVSFRIDNFRIVPTESSTWNGTVISKMNRIQAVKARADVPGTTLCFVPQHEVNMDAANLLRFPAEICISDWDSLPKPIPVPSRFTLAGIIETKEEVTTTTPLDGTPKQKCKFTLIDSQGRWLECTAVGFNAQAPALEIGSQVVLWFAIALKALGNEGARCAVLNDGVIAPVTEETAMIPARGAQMLFQD